MRVRVLLIVPALFLGACATTVAPNGRLRQAASRGAVENLQEGEASFYSDSLAGHHTASGVPYDPDAMTAAHRTLPFGTVVRVTRVDTGRSVEVTVNDRGPYAGANRIIDLSRRAARELAMERRGVAPVRVEVIALGSGRRR